MSLMQNINWSFSKLNTYEACALRFKLQYIEKIPEPPRAPDNPMERGNRIHNNLERFVKGLEGGDLADNEAKRLPVFYPALHHLKTLYDAGQAHAEDNWWFNDAWEVQPACGKCEGCTRGRMCYEADIWLWAKLDFIVVDEDNAHAIAGDYKSGKSMYKAIEHVQQLQLYAAVTAIKYPELEKLTAELWYVDEGHVKSATYTREEAMKFVGRFDQRAQRIYNDRFFRPNPNKITCAYCPYGPKRGNGHCPVGV